MKRSFILMTLLALFGLQHPTSAAIIKKSCPDLLVGRYEKSRVTSIIIWREHLVK